MGEAAELIRRERDITAPFICNSERALKALRYWLKERPPFNAVRCAKNAADPAIGLGFASLDGTENDYTPAGLILCSDEALKSHAKAMVERAIRRRAEHGGREP